MTNAKAEPLPAGQDDQSMEEILQSIRRIIAEEGDDAGTRPPPEQPEEEAEEENDTFHYSEKAETPPAKDAKSDASPAADVLELTDVIKEDGSVINISAKPSIPKAMTGPTGSDLLESIDEVIVPTPTPAAPKAASPVLSDDEERLVSQDKAAAAAATIKAFADSKAKPVPVSKIESPTFRSGATVEDLVLETLRPMLREWLDTYLEQIVQRAVEREIKRIAAQNE